jgi:AraC-like DNA-binding protein
MDGYEKAGAGEVSRIAGEVAVPDYRPRMVSHRYWRAKQEFQLREDTYAHWVVFAVEDGQFTYEINGGKGVASRGDLVFCPPGVPFCREVLTPVSFHFVLLDWVDAAGQLVAQPPTMADKLTIRDHDRLSSTYLRLRKWNGVEHALALRLKHHLLEDLWYLYLEEAAMESGQSNLGSSDRKDKMQEAQRTIQEQALAPFSLKELAARLGLSQVQFTRSFRQATGLLPRDYLISIRLHKVQELLLESDQTLGQIAEQCGYENEFYLSRIFTKRMGVTPSHFRKLHRL